MGNRIAKHVYDASWNWEKSTFYVRDAQGNVMATYDQTESMSLMSYKVKERDIYGSSRLGMYAQEAELLGAGAYDTSNFSHVSGDRQYELSNHLGNVLAVVTDKVLPKDWDNDDTTDNYWVEMLSASDYYPFGAPMEGRSFQSANYRYGFNGKEKDDETHGNNGDAYDFGARMYDARLGRWLCIDPSTDKYPDLCPYVFVSNTPLRAVDPDGNDIIVLSAPASTAHLGHAAVLIGNDKDGWTLYSKNGTYGSSSGSASSGESNKNPQNGVYVGSLENFKKNYNPVKDGKAEYQGGFRITTSAENDQKMKQAASKTVSSWYDVTGMISTSCIDVASNALEAADLDPGYEDIGSIGAGQQSQSIPRSPNERYYNITKRNEGVDVSDLIVDKDAERKATTEESLKEMKARTREYNVRDVTNVQPRIVKPRPSR